MQRFVSTGLNPTRAWVWVYFEDRRLVVPRRHAVRVPWTHIADQWQTLSDGVDRVFTARVEAMQEVAQLPLPLENWE